MRKSFIIAALVLTATEPAVRTAFACGDILMGVARGVRFGQVVQHTRAISILAYVPPSSSVPSVLRDLEMHLKSAGDQLEVVADPNGLDAALRTGKFDLVLADAADAEGLLQQVRATPSHPVMLPVVYKLSKAEEAAAVKKFPVILKAPGDADRYLTAIDKAIQQKSKGIDK